MHLCVSWSLICYVFVVHSGYCLCFYSYICAVAGGWFDPRFGEKCPNDTLDLTIVVRDLASNITDGVLQETFFFPTKPASLTRFPTSTYHLLH